MKRPSAAFRSRAQAAFLGAVAFLAGAAGLRLATSPGSPTAGAAEAGTAPPTAPPAAALRVAIDPETGSLGMPTDAALKAAALPVPQGPLPPMDVLPDGTLRMNVQGHYRNYSLARVGADGHIETECTHDADAARRFLHGETVPVAETVSPPIVVPEVQ